MNRHQRLIAAVLALLTSVGGASAATVDADTMIDENHPLSGQGLTFDGGVDGPTHVEVVEGGELAGFAAGGGTTVLLNGGTISSTFSLYDDATLKMNRGTVGCIALGCQLQDYDVFAILGDRSRIEIRGAGEGLDSLSSVELRDDSTMVVFGTNLRMQLEKPGTALVSGTLLDGTALNTAVSFTDSFDRQVALVEVPEPASQGLFLMAILVARVVCSRR